MAGEVDMERRTQALAGKPPVAPAGPAAPAAAAVIAGQAAVEYQGVSYSYPRAAVGDGGTAEVLHDVSLRVEPGEVLGILGPNGAGKTTLVKLTLGLLPVQRGRIRVFGMSPVLEGPPPEIVPYLAVTEPSRPPPIVA